MEAIAEDTAIGDLERGNIKDIKETELLDNLSNEKITDLVIVTDRESKVGISNDSQKEIIKDLKYNSSSEFYQEENEKKSKFKILNIFFEKNEVLYLSLITITICNCILGILRGIDIVYGSECNSYELCSGDVLYIKILDILFYSFCIISNMYSIYTYYKSESGDVASFFYYSLSGFGILFDLYLSIVPLSSIISNRSIHWSFFILWTVKSIILLTLICSYSIEMYSESGFNRPNKKNLSAFDSGGLLVRLFNYISISSNFGVLFYVIKQSSFNVLTIMPLCIQIIWYLFLFCSTVMDEYNGIVYKSIRDNYKYKITILNTILDIISTTYISIIYYIGIYESGYGFTLIYSTFTSITINMFRYALDLNSQYLKIQIN